MSLNKVSLIGHVGQNPDIRQSKDGKLIAVFSLATSKYWTDKRTGERMSKPEWHRICVFSQPLAETVKKYVKKGTKLYLEGELQTRSWTDKQGIEKFVTEVVLGPFNSSLKLLSGKPNEEQPAQETAQERNDRKMDEIAASFEDGSVEHLDDQIPF